ncbi:uncharacterized protein F5147DRAFT_822658 [Suillus discolor]|uniref:Uncharacterized protein n=1 Tax=Suillus discolor TaxID=1912936 RepID=A0A9P7JMZ8_9AGAM|nr:uncharacterized protein F5147DRAFT_822658 [Suillus discolor]KAG2092160.1 hypothetical protein F5147DRAFT_822658 [Suillus discolor]
MDRTAENWTKSPVRTMVLDRTAAALQTKLRGVSASDGVSRLSAGISTLVQRKEYVCLMRLPAQSVVSHNEPMRSMSHVTHPFELSNLMFIWSHPYQVELKDHHDKFNKTGAGVTPLDEHAAANLHKQVLLEFPWYDQLHPFLFSNPTISAKIFTSQPGVDHAADYYSLIRPCGGAGPSTNPPGPQLPQLHPQNSQPPPPDPQLLPPDPQLPLWSPPDTSAQCAPPSIRPGPMGAQHAPQHPPPHFSGTGGSPIDDPDGDLDDDPHANDNGPFFAPLGNMLGMLDGGTLTWMMTMGWSLTPPIIVSSAFTVPPGWWDRSGLSYYVKHPTCRKCSKTNYKSKVRTV